MVVLATRAGTLGLAVAVVCGCNHASIATSPGEAPLDASVRAALVDASSAAAPPADASPQAAPVEQVLSPRDYSGRPFRCGPGTCTSGAQMCCASTGCPAEASCRPIDWDAGAALDSWEAWPCGDADHGVVACPKALAACTSRHPGHCDAEEQAFLKAQTCADSRDCAGALCCTAGGSLTPVCTSVDRCAGYELCQGDLGCRTPGTHCVHGECRSTHAHVPCGDHVCSGAASACQFPDWRRRTPDRAPRCLPYPSDTSTGHYECISARDCPAAQRCVWASYNGDGGGQWDASFCRFTVNDGTFTRTHTCDTDADCADVASALIGVNQPLSCQNVAVGPTCMRLCALTADESSPLVDIPRAPAMSRCGAVPGHPLSGKP